MLELGIELSSKIKVEEINNKKVFIIEKNYMVACFDKDIDEDTIKRIAEKHPFYAIFMIV